MTTALLVVAGLALLGVVLLGLEVVRLGRRVTCLEDDLHLTDVAVGMFQSSVRVLAEAPQGQPTIPTRPRCTSTHPDLPDVRCSLDAEHVHGGPTSHGANPREGDGSTWSGPGFISWVD